MNETQDGNGIMKRNMELVRELLLCVESDQGFASLNSKYSQEDVVGHVEILLDAKLLEGKVYKDLSGAPGSVFVQRLTWAGHEFLDNARNDTVWNKVTATIKNAATTTSFEVLVEMLKVGVLAAIQK